MCIPIIPTQPHMHLFNTTTACMLMLLLPDGCHDSHPCAGFGVYYVLAMVHCVLVMRERQRTGTSEVPVPLVPSILRSLKNWAFR